MRIAATVLFALCLSICSFAGEEFKHGPDSEYHEGVPKGKVEQQPRWLSKIFPGTERDWWIYVPAQYDPATPANVMVFQDGGGPVSATGEMRVPVVFDNLIHKKELPVTIGIFINPGVLPSTDMSTIEVEVPGKDGAPAKKEKRPVKQPRQNRSFEYDSMGDRYARFLIEEILPEVEKKYKLTQDPAGRALCGQSSGGSCAFTAAWERPDVFGKVVSGIGSFTSIHGCNAYPDLIRKMEPKPIRIYMQDGDHDLDIFVGSWWHANMDMAAAFRFMGYDYFFLQGHDGHNGKQLGVNFPDAMRWLWRTEPVAGKRPEKLDPRGIFEVLIADEGWKKVAAIETPPVFRAAADDDGNIYYLESNAKGAMDIKKIDANGKAALYAGTKEPLENIAFAPDGKLFAIAQKRIFAVEANGSLNSLIDLGRDISAVAVNQKGEMYCEVPGAKKIMIVNLKSGEKKEFDYSGDVHFSLCFTPDQGFLVSIAPEKWELQSARVALDGTLEYAEPFYSLQALEGQDHSRAFGSAVDSKGRLYVSSVNGIQILDQGGRVVGILTLPMREHVFGIAFGGSNFDTLYAVTMKGIFARKLNAKGVRSCKPPVVVPGPRM